MKQMNRHSMKEEILRKMKEWRTEKQRKIDGG